MALVVEDGSGVPGAESYFSIESADAYWAARPQDARAATWAAGAPEKKEGAAREASAYLDATWCALFLGFRKSATQGRLWPRVARIVLDPTCFESIEAYEAAQAASDEPLIGSDGLLIEGVPPAVSTAAIELAGRALTARLAQDKGEEGWLKRRKVGPIEREWGGPGVPGGSFGAVDGILAPVLSGPRNPALASAAPQWNWR